MLKCSKPAGFGALKLGIASAACLMLAGLGDVSLATTGTNAAAEATKADGAATTAVSLSNAAMELAREGREVNDPLLLLAAARVLLSVGARDGDGEVSSEPLPADAPAASGGASEKADAERRDLAASLIADARLLARGDATVIALASAVENTASKGSVTGPGAYYPRVDARSTTTISERYRGGQLAEAAIYGDGDTDVDLYVYDQNGNLICADTRSSDRGYCRWVPAWTGTYYIQLRNYGGVYNDVQLRVN